MILLELGARVMCDGLSFIQSSRRVYLILCIHHHSTLYNLSLLTLCLICGTWILAEQLIPEVAKLWAAKRADLRAKILLEEAGDLSNGLEKWCSRISETGLGGLEEEAG